MTLGETGEMGEGAEEGRTKLVTFGETGEMGEGRTKAVAIDGEATSSRLRWLITLVCSVSDRRVYYDLLEVYRALRPCDTRAGVWIVCYPLDSVLAVG